MLRNPENLQGLLPDSYEFIHTPTHVARNHFLYIEYIGHAFCDKRYYLSRRSYAHFLLMYVVGGRAVLFVEGREYIAHPGQAFLIQTEKPHIYGAFGDMEAFWVHFNGRHFEEYYRHLVATNGGHVFTVKNQMDFSVKFLDLIRDQANPAPQPEVLTSIRLNELLALLLLGDADTEESPINKAITFINRHYSEKISLDMLSGLVSISVSRFCALFKQETGYSPYQYIINTRLHAARQMLNNTGDPIEHIALSVGFGDASSFIYSFKQKYKVTPAQFRKRLTGMRRLEEHRE